ncbi:MAG TPA: EpsI family protein [Gemmatimonadales bacterium]|nr:EpsI family protein [Gemmatimonadales bacterium]
MPRFSAWIPGTLLLLGAALNSSLVARRAGVTPLAGNLQSVADTVLGAAGVDNPVPEEEARVAGFSDYIRRDYTTADGRSFSLYVGYYDEQRQGKTIHSPRNCLPGAGWDPVGRSVVHAESAAHGTIGLNRYELVNEDRRAIVYYWYQGRGRVAHNEYKVKYELLRDAALRGRTEEALVRIVVMVNNDDVAAADAIALEVAGPLADDVERVLPQF